MGGKCKQIGLSVSVWCFIRVITGISMMLFAWSAYCGTMVPYG